MIAEADIPGALRAILELPGVAGPTRYAIESYLEFPDEPSKDDFDGDDGFEIHDYRAAVSDFQDCREEMGALIMYHWSQLVEVGAV